MDLKLRQMSDKTQYERIKNFGSEIDTLNIEKFMVIAHEVINHQRIPLYVLEYEDVLVRYFFSKEASDYFRTLEWCAPGYSPDIFSNDYVEVSRQCIEKFGLVRVIEPNKIVPDESYLRVVRNE